MTSKKYYFLAGLPRAGNTLFASIFNQNPKINVTANSIVSSLMHGAVYAAKVNPNTKSIFDNFPDEKSFFNFGSNILNNYYSDWPGEIIIDRSSWGEPFNLKLLEDFCPNKPKFICLVRPVSEILCSFLTLYKKNNNIKKLNKSTIEFTCDTLFKRGEILDKGITSCLNLKKSKYAKDTLFIQYEDFCKNTKTTIDSVYSFLDLSTKKHEIKNLKNLKVNNVSYDDSIDINYQGLHKIKKCIEVVEHDTSVLPKNILEHCNYLDLELSSHYASATK